MTLRSPKAGAGRKSWLKDLSTATRAFTRSDLLVIMAILALLALMLLPALARTRTDSRAFQCLNNLRELTRAWRMYCDDSQDSVPYAAADTAATRPYAWVNGFLDNNSNNQSNWNPDQDLKKSPLWKYAGASAAVWRCPGDASYVVVNGTARPRARSYWMNLFVGGWGYTDGGFGWSTTWKLFAKTTDVGPMPPARLFVLTDLREDYGGTSFQVSMAGNTPPSPSQYTFYELPGLRHDRGAHFSFADGSVEIRRWRDARTTPPLITSDPPAGSIASPNNTDIAWLQQRATRPK